MPARSPCSAPSRRRALWLITALAVAARVGAALYLGDDVTPQPGTADQVSYHALALRVLDGYGFSFAVGWWPATPAGQPTAHWSYLYVLYLTAVYGLFGPHPLVARVAQAVAVGVLQPLLSYSVARRLFGPRVGLIAATVVALYAYFVYYAGALMTESFFIVALLWCVETALRLGQVGRPTPAVDALRPWVTFGAALATAVLLRQAILVCVPLVLAWVAWRCSRWRPGAPAGRRIGLGTLTVRLGLTVCVVAICILPWTVRNYRTFHQFVLLNTNAGFAFYWGNHPIHGSSFVPILPGDGSLYGKLIPDELQGLNEAEMDRVLLRRGLGFVAEDPARYLRLTLSRTREFVRFWPSSDSGRVGNVARVLSFGVCAPFILAGMVLAWRRPSVLPPHRSTAARAGTWLVLGVALVYSMAHLLTWTLVRYRLPVDALLLPFAALSLMRLCDRVAPFLLPVQGGVLSER